MREKGSQSLMTKAAERMSFDQVHKKHSINCPLKRSSVYAEVNDSVRREELLLADMFPQTEEKGIISENLLIYR